MTATLAELKRIRLDSVYFRHPIEEERLIAIMSYVLANKRWDLPPPLVVQQSSRGLRYFWVLDGHHRISAAKLCESAVNKQARIWAFVVSEREYQTLILNKFSGVEPAAIREVREHIGTPFGDANMTDETWGALRGTLHKKPSASFPVFVSERIRSSVSDIGFFTAGFTLDGDIWIKDSRSQRTVIKMSNPPLQKTVKENQSIRLKGNDGEDFQIDISAKWDFVEKCAEFEVKSKGIRLSEAPVGAKAPNSGASKNIVVTKEKLYNHSRLIMSAIRRINQEFEGIAVDGIDAEQRDAPWFLLDEFEFRQPQLNAAPDPSEFRRSPANFNWARHGT
jgi:hypothetical protein